MGSKLPIIVTPSLVIRPINVLMYAVKGSHEPVGTVVSLGSDAETAGKFKVCSSAYARRTVS